MTKTKVAIIGSGNIGTDLMFKVMRHRRASSRWARWSASTRPPTAWRAPRGSAWPTTARGRRRTDRACRSSTTSTSSSTPPRRGRTVTTTRCCAPHGKRLIDLTPAAIGPYRRAGGQPRRAPRRAERQHGHLRRPGDDSDRRRGRPRWPRCTTPRSSPRSPRSPPARARAPISTSSPRPPRAAIEKVGGAASGKAIIVLNPAEPPLIMRDTVYCLSRRRRPGARSQARSKRWSPTVQAYVPGYRLKQEVQFERSGADDTGRPDPGRRHASTA